MEPTKIVRPSSDAAGVPTTNESVSTVHSKTPVRVSSLLSDVPTGTYLRGRGALAQRRVAAAPRLLDDATKETRRRFLRDGLGVGPGAQRW
mmetsp:Transcript_27106/g.81809  ORF Transcript_27106/g.81809 Transcript_27106/m.81809 type:complete len:91 (-) Transcript_27106:1168-1440(-)